MRSLVIGRIDNRSGISLNKNYKLPYNWTKVQVFKLCKNFIEVKAKSFPGCY